MKLNDVYPYELRVFFQELFDENTHYHPDVCFSTEIIDKRKLLCFCNLFKKYNNYSKIDFSSYKNQNAYIDILLYEDNSEICIEIDWAGCAYEKLVPYKNLISCFYNTNLLKLIL